MVPARRSSLMRSATTPARLRVIEHEGRHERERSVVLLHDHRLGHHHARPVGRCTGRPWCRRSAPTCLRSMQRAHVRARRSGTRRRPWPAARNSAPARGSSTRAGEFAPRSQSSRRSTRTTSCRRTRRSQAAAVARPAAGAARTGRGTTRCTCAADRPGSKPAHARASQCASKPQAARRAQQRVRVVAAREVEQAVAGGHEQLEAIHGLVDLRTGRRPHAGAAQHAARAGHARHRRSRSRAWSAARRSAPARLRLRRQASRSISNTQPCHGCTSRALPNDTYTRPSSRSGTSRVRAAPRATARCAGENATSLVSVQRPAATRPARFPGKSASSVRASRSTTATWWLRRARSPLRVR